MRQTVEALQKNLLASESELIIYSDGFKSELDSDKHQEYLLRITVSKTSCKEGIQLICHSSWQMYQAN